MMPALCDPCIPASEMCSGSVVTTMQKCHLPVQFVIFTFLQELMAAGKAPSTLNVYMAAISMGHNQIAGATSGHTL